MSKNVRMADIAKRIGVSTVTVSKALADKEGVSDEIRDKIKNLAREMGYHFEDKTKKLEKRTGNIGILIPEGFVTEGSSFYWLLYQRLINYLSESGYYGILEIVKREERQELKKPHVLQDKKIDGLILIGQEIPAYREMLRKQSGVPVVFLDSYDILDGSDCVISDGYCGMYAVTAHLISMGHKDIRFVGTLNVTSSINDRYSGYCRAMMEHGLTVTQEMVIPDRFGDGEIGITLPETMPTAFACNCDLTACNLISLLKEHGYRVPEDISVAGFDGYVYPGLGYNDAITTYTVDTEMMVQTCANLLLRKINNPKHVSSLKIIPGQFIARETTAPVKTDV